jgi:DNA-binding response OmpR family regulator
MGDKILIVDDEKLLARFLQQNLQLEWPDCLVDVAYSGEEALSRLARSGYDLILADIRMPGFDGLELVRGVRYVNPDVPIIIITGYGSDAIRDEAAEMGVSYCLDKPFNLDELMWSARQLLTEKVTQPLD